MRSVLKGAYGTQKPPAGVGINRGHPFSAALAACWPFNESGGMGAYELTGRYGMGALNAPAAFGVGTLGPALKSDGSTNSYATLWANGPILGGHFAWTISSLIATTAAVVSGGRAIYCEHNISGTDLLKLDSMFATGTGNAAITYRNDGGTLIQLQGSKVINDGKPHLIAATKSGTAIKLYVDGKLDASGTFGSSSDAFTNAGIVCRAMADTNTTSRLSGENGFITLWTRALSPSEIEALYAAPFVFLGSAPAWMSTAQALAGAVNIRKNRPLPARVVSYIPPAFD